MRITGAVDEAKWLYMPDDKGGDPSHIINPESILPMTASTSLFVCTLGALVVTANLDWSTQWLGLTKLDNRSLSLQDTCAAYL